MNEVIYPPENSPLNKYIETTVSFLKEKIIAALATVKDIAPAKRVENRIEKDSKMGFWEEA